MDLDAILADLFPIASVQFTLEYVPGSLRRRPAGTTIATLRRVDVDPYDDDDDEPLTSDVELIYTPHLDDPRLPAYLTGWANAVRSLLARLDELEMVGGLPEFVYISLPDLGYPEVLYYTHLVTPAQFERALLFGRSRLGRFLPDSLDVPAAFAGQLPVAAGSFTVELVPETVDENTGEVSGGFHENLDGSLMAVLRSSVWDGEGDARTLREVREADVTVARGEHGQDPRLAEYFAGWAAALRTLFERHAALDASDVRRATLEQVDPTALVWPDVLALSRPQTADAFAAALLTDRRLGKLLA